MNIAIISSPYLPIPPKKYGGTERVMFYLIKGLTELGHHVILFAPGDSKVDCELIPICETSMNFEVDPEKEKAMQVKRVEAANKAKEELRKNLHRIDLIHSHGIDISEFTEKPNLFTLHGQMTFELFKFHDTLAKKGVFFNTISKDQMKTSWNLNVVGEIYNGEDPEDFPLVEEPEEYFSYLGRYSLDKNPDLAIKLAIQLEKDIKVAAKLDFAGLEYYNKDIKPLLTNKHVIDLGEQDDKEKAVLLGNARINLHPTGFREPFGLTVLEASYSGTPTIAIRKGAMSELIEDGRTGILVDDFVEAVFRVDECYRMDRKYIAERARRLFNYKIMAKQYELAYENIIRIYKEGNNNPEALPEELAKSRGSIEGQYAELTRIREEE